MTTITLNYDECSPLLKQIISLAIWAGACPVEKQENTVKKQYERLFGKKKIYSENEIFVFNSMRNAQKILEKYGD